MAQVESGFVNGFLGGLGPKVEMVARCPALETPEHIAAKIGRKGAVFSSLGRFMERTFAPYLVAHSFGHDKPQEFQDFSHGHDGPNFPKVDAGPSRTLGIREEEPVILRPTGRPASKQYARLG